MRSATRRCSPRWAGSSSNDHCSMASWFHSPCWPNSPPMNSSFLPGWAHMKA
ncbi:Uncharacterised protein [Bordetella pertussis]|nr:Uncharacterised protein [Bordetella pertussis]CFP62630.1 Uncharacterised protein [Bordetella pertussis]